MCRDYEAIREAGKAFILKTIEQENKKTALIKRGRENYKPHGPENGEFFSQARESIGPTIFPAWEATLSNCPLKYSKIAPLPGAEKRKRLRTES